MKSSYESKVIHDYDKLNKEKKNLTFMELNGLIKKMKFNYNANETEEIMNELGINTKNECIEIESLLTKSREQRENSKYSDFYEALINLFMAPTERILKILEDCKIKLKEINKSQLVKELDWVIKVLNNDDIYNLNLDLLTEIDKNKLEMGEGTDIENTMKFLTEYSSDAFNQRKKEDVKVARKISIDRMKQEQFMNNPTSTRTSKTALRNYSVMFKDPLPFPVSGGHSRSNNNSISLPQKSTYFSEKAINIMRFQIINEEEETPFPNVSQYQTMQPPNNYIDYFSNKENTDHEIKSSILISNLDGCESDNEDNKEPKEIIQAHSPLMIPKSKKNSTNSVIGKTSFSNNNVEIPLLPLKLISTLNVIDDIDFNIFNYSESVGRENVLINVAEYIFETYSLYVIIHSIRFETFLDKIRVGYDYLLPYHNDLHATDVLQTCHLFTQFSNLKTEMDITTLDLSAFFIASIIHDFKHPGLNNSYHINKRSQFAIRYNDVSVLENYHVSAAFKIISQPNSNIFCNLQPEEYRVVRKRIVECVLATDMAKHAKSQISLKIKIDHLKNKTGTDRLVYNLINNANEDSKFDRQQEILNFLIHCADISNPGKKFDLSKKWTKLVMEEFFLQGDLEMSEKLPVSFLCDRRTTNVPKSQIAFISNICVPCFKILSLLSPLCNNFLNNMYDNIEFWKKEEEEDSNKNI